MIQSILVPTDFSDHAEAAMMFAKRLAQVTKSQVHILSVAQPILTAVTRLALEFADDNIRAFPIAPLAKLFQAELIVLTHVISTAQFLPFQANPPIPIGENWQQLLEHEAKERLEELAMLTGLF